MNSFSEVPSSHLLTAIVSPATRLNVRIPSTHDAGFQHILVPIQYIDGYWHRHSARMDRIGGTKWLSQIAPVWSSRTLGWLRLAQFMILCCHAMFESQWKTSSEGLELGLKETRFNFGVGRPLALH
jgi:hypothetical protein